MSPSFSAARPYSLHRPLNVAPDRLAEISCLRNKCHVRKDLTREPMGK